MSESPGRQKLLPPVPCPEALILNPWTAVRLTLTYNQSDYRSETPPDFEQPKGFVCSPLISDVWALSLALRSIYSVNAPWISAWVWMGGRREGHTSCGRRCGEESTCTAFPRRDANCGLTAPINHSTISLTYKELRKINKTRLTTNF